MPHKHTYMPNTELIGVDTALRRQIAKRIHNVAFQRPSFLGLLMGLDTFYNKRAKGHLRVNKLGIKGGKMQFNFWTSLPEVRGTNALNPDYSSRQIPIVKNTRHAAGTLDASSYEAAEPVDQYEINRMVGDDALPNLVSKTADLFAEAFITRINSDMFPAVNQTGGVQTYANQIDRIMSLAYPLQSGYANNASNGSGAYNYLGIDMNAAPNVGMKALNVGDTGGKTAPTVTNIRQKLLMPLRARGANIDVLLMGADDFSTFCNSADAQIQQPYTQEMTIGTEWAKFGNVFVVYEPMIDPLPMKEIYALDSSTWTFGMTESGVDKIDLVDKVPGAPSYNLLQAYAEFAFACENPRFNGRMFNTGVA